MKEKNETRIVIFAYEHTYTRWDAKQSKTTVYFCPTGLYEWIEVVHFLAILVLFCIYKYRIKIKVEFIFGFVYIYFWSHNRISFGANMFVFILEQMTKQRYVLACPSYVCEWHQTTSTLASHRMCSHWREYGKQTRYFLFCCRCLMRAPAIYSWAWQNTHICDISMGSARRFIVIISFPSFFFLFLSALYPFFLVAPATRVF